VTKDLTKVMLIDNIIKNCKLQPQNGVFIKTWKDDIRDVWLMELEAVLRGK
jgi:TFIIF-interacting CTD phosphatase-like protein